MEKNKIDKLFREQLMQHTVTPSPEAWSRLQQGMERKKKPFFFWMVAASLALVISLAVWLLPQQTAVEMLVAEQEISMPIQEQENGWSQASTAPLEPMEEPTQEETAPATGTTASRTTYTKKETKIEVQAPRIETEIALIQAEIRKPILEGFDAAELVVPPHLEAPKKVIQSAGLEIEIYQNLTAPDSVKTATAAKKNLLKQVINAAIDVKSGDLELSDLIDLNKVRVNQAERRNN